MHYGYSASLHASLYNGGFFSSESYVGEKRKYTCANGTVPVGGNQVTCLANGQWEKPMFKCQGSCFVSMLHLVTVTFSIIKVI